MADPMTHEDQRRLNADTYGKYVATGPIDIGGARAFNAGDPVPTGHVEGDRQGAYDPVTQEVTWTDVPPRVDRSMVRDVTEKPPKGRATAATDENPKG